MFLAIVFLFTILPAPLTALEREEQEVYEEIERIREELHILLDENSDKVKQDFLDRAHKQIDDRIDMLQASEDYTPNQKLFLAQSMKQRIMVSIELQIQIYEIRDIIDNSETGEKFIAMLHEIVDRLEERLDVTESDIEKYEDVRRTRKEIEELIKKQLEMFEETKDSMTQENQEEKEALEETENEILQDIVDAIEKMEQAETEQEKEEAKQEMEEAFQQIPELNRDQLEDLVEDL
jgi:hypothetical protein